MEIEETLPIPRAAELLHCSRKALKKWIAEFDLEYDRRGRGKYTNRVSVALLKRIIEKQSPHPKESKRA